VESGASRLTADEIARTVIEILSSTDGAYLGRLSVLVFTEDIDPNQLLNAEDGYSSAANILDTQLDGDAAGINSGCVVEVFDSLSLAEERFLRLASYFSSLGRQAQRLCLAGSVLFRIPQIYDETSKQQFMDAFREFSIPRNLKFTVDNEINKLLADDPNNPVAQAKTIAGIKEVLPQLSDVSDDQIRSILLRLCAMKTKNPDYATFQNFLLEIQDELRSPPASVFLAYEQVGTFAGHAAGLCPNAIGWLTALINEATAEEHDPPAQSLSSGSRVGANPSSASQAFQPSEPGDGVTCVQCGTGADVTWAYCGTCGSPLQ